MNNKLNPLVIVGAAALVVASLAGATGQLSGMACCGGIRTATQSAPKPVVAKDVKGIQKATVVVNNGYSPVAVVVKQGEPVELTFTGGKNIGCGGTVVFESLKISKDVSTGKSVTVKFTPRAKGEIPFTCGMGMLHGTVIVK